MPDSAKFIEKAEKLVQKGRLDEAVQEYLQALAADPNNEGVIEIVAELYLRQGLAPKGQECYLYLFERLRERGDTPKATLVFRKLLKIGPQEPPKMMEYAALLEKNKPEEAAAIYQAASDSFREKKDLAGALEAMKRLAALDPADGDLQCLLGEIAVEAGQKEEATAAFMRAAEIQRRQAGSRGGAESVLPLVERAYQVSGDRSIVVSLAGLLLETGKAKRAVDLLRPLAATPGVSPEVLRILGEACLGIGDAAGAESALVSLAGTHPDVPKLLTRTAQRYLETGHVDLAVSLLERLKDSLQGGGRLREFAVMVDQIPETLRTKAPYLEFLATLYGELGLDEKAARALARLFDLHFAERAYLPATDALDRMARIDPYDADSRRRLQSLQGKIDQQRWQSIAAIFGDSVTAAPTPTEAAAQAPAAAAAASDDTEESDFMITKRDWRDSVRDSDSPAPKGEGSGGDPEYEASILEDLILQAEIFIQYGLTSKAVERLERVNKLFPGEEDRNEKLRTLYETAGVKVQKAAAGAKPAPAAAESTDGDEVQVDFGRASEITRNIFRQGTVKNVLFAAVNDVGRTWYASKCVAAMCTPGKTPSVLLEYCASGQKQSDAFNLVKLIQGLQKISTDGLPQAIDDAESSPKLQPLGAIVKALAVKSLLALPLIEGDQHIGVIILEQCDRRRKWRSSEVMVLKAVADQMVMAASHVKLRSLMKSLAVTDERTGMLLRAAYLDCLLAEISRWQQQGGELCVALAQFGQGVSLVREAGEEAVRKFVDETGLAISSHLRQNDVAVRYDSTTVALVMPGTKGSDGLQVMEKMRRIVGGVKIKEKIPPFTYGVVEPIRDPSTDAVDNVTELINRAEQALEEAHKAGGNVGRLLAAAV